MFFKRIIVFVCLPLFFTYTHSITPSQAYTLNPSSQNTSFSIVLPCGIVSNSVVLDSNGNAWVAGTSGGIIESIPRLGPQLPCLISAEGEKSYSISYLFKFSPNGVLLYASPFSGNHSTNISTLRVDSMDNLIVIGSTKSTSFPTYRAFQEKAQGETDIFVMKLNSSMDIMFCTLLGGNDKDFDRALCVGPNDHIYLTGYTLSKDFPLHPPIKEKEINGQNIFIAEFSPEGNLLHSSRFGGSAFYDVANDIAVDDHNYLIIAGRASSWDFPGAVVSPQPGSRDASFISIFSPLKELVNSQCLERYEHHKGNSIYHISLTSSGDLVVHGSGMVKGFKMPVNTDKSVSYQATISKEGTISDLKHLPHPRNINRVLIDTHNNMILGGIEIVDPLWKKGSFVNAETLYREILGDGGVANLSVMLPTGDYYFSLNFGVLHLDIIRDMSLDDTGYLWIVGVTNNLGFPRFNDYLSPFDDPYGTSFVIRLRLPPSLAKPKKLLLQIGQVKATFMETGKVTLLPPLEAPPMIVQGRTLIPLRVLAETMGMEVSWVSAGQYIWLDRDGVRLELQIGRNFAWKYALDAPEKREKLEMDVPPMIVNNRTLLPLRFVTENFGALVDWNGFEQRILVSWE
jgi:hypothetical protein